LKAKLIANVLPPIVYRALLRIYLLARGHGWHIFYGCYPTLGDVPSDPRGQNSDWYTSNAAKQVENLKLELSHRPMGDEAGQLVLPLAFSQLLSGTRGTVTVLDFGGGAAHGLKKIFEHVPNPDLTKFNYILVETPAMCGAIRDRLSAIQKERFGGASFIEVKDTIPASLPHPLIIHANSSLQYISDYRDQVSRLLALAPEIFIVAHTPVSDAPTYACQQTNIPHHRLARWVFNRCQLISEIEKEGYRLALTFDHELPINYKKAPGPETDASMIFYRLAA
jgi:putative methyltransferase (TIGR04325 family)